LLILGKIVSTETAPASGPPPELLLLLLLDPLPELLAPELPVPLLDPLLPVPPLDPLLLDPLPLPDPLLLVEPPLLAGPLLDPPLLLVLPLLEPLLEEPEPDPDPPLEPASGSNVAVWFEQFSAIPMAPTRGTAMAAVRSMGFMKILRIRVM
jgi:hypothetical protein